MASRPHLDSFTKGYVTAALWSSTDDDGSPMDQNYDTSDIDTSTLRKMKADSLKFKRKARKDLDESGLSDSSAGHDFWLTRNGHGAGFWDRGLGVVGDRLSNIAKTFGGYWLHVGADGKIYG